MKAPVHTLAIRLARVAAVRIKANVSAQAEASRDPDPPATINVSRGSSENGWAISWTADELVTGPAVRAITRGR